MQIALMVSVSLGILYFLFLTVTRTRIQARECTVPITIITGIAALSLAVNIFFLPWGMQWVTDVIMTICVILFIFVIFFFRDPERRIKADSGSVLSPGDGTVDDIEEDVKIKYMPGKVTKVGMFLSIFNVHIQRMPMNGGIKKIEDVLGVFMPANNPEVAQNNRQKVYVIEGSQFTFVVKQIAGMIAQKTVAWVKEGDELTAGEKIGMIKFSSRVEIYLPKEVKLNVKEGDKVRAGLSVIGFIGEAKPVESKAGKKGRKAG